MNEAKINVYLITGFLGAGKTTFLNELLQEFRNHQNVIIENEFGKINIDATLISGKYDSLFELTNGCICCSLNNKLLDVLHEITTIKNDVTNLFIETTGIADVGEISAIFSTHLIGKHFELKKIICLVDVLTYEKNSIEITEINRQLVASDLIILNKTEDLSLSECSDFKNLIQNLNPFAEITQALNAKIDFKLLLHPRNAELNFIQIENSKTPHEIKSVLFETDAYFDLNMLKYTIFKTLFLSYNQLYRVKGYVKTPDNVVHLVQSVGKSVVTAQTDTYREKSQLVVIGKGIATSSIERLFKTALAKPANQYT